MSFKAAQPLIEVGYQELGQHGLATQQEALLRYAETGDYASIYHLYSQAVGSTALVPVQAGAEHRYFLMTRLSEVQWIQREDDEAIILWDFRNEVVVVLRLRGGGFEARMLARTIKCDEASPISMSA